MDRNFKSSVRVRCGGSCLWFMTLRWDHKQCRGSLGYTVRFCHKAKQNKIEHRVFSFTELTPGLSFSKQITQMFVSTKLSFSPMYFPSNTSRTFQDIHSLTFVHLFLKYKLDKKYTHKNYSYPTASKRMMVSRLAKATKWELVTNRKKKQHFF